MPPTLLLALPLQIFRPYNQFVRSNHQTTNSVIPIFFHELIKKCFGPIISLLSYSTAQTEKNLRKKLGKTKLFVWWIDVTNKMLVHFWSWAYVIYEWSHSKKRPRMRPASWPPDLARDSKRTSDWIRPPSALLPMEARAVAGTFKIVQYYWQT